MNKSEKELRKQLKANLRQKAAADFENSLPMSRENFRLLFDFLDDELQNNECDNLLTITITFLQHQNISNPEQVMSWLADHGGYCDCEVLANVEEHFN
ncbi:hypothetical protein GCM10007423_36610 [Dyadobacter endophyticus]|uniref:DUF2695 domain-containing protein n=1 Tax=Dyadobacter endophyticus TaxID=1749036 RepID=A0ABQ1YYD0_9BACT|nr:DUF2695 domain-containing protein [Dyadobacter endophyticus]GGH41065.1 hypothetical protein GCM10007423_36610 [Dyadobacter endophyticus]